MGKVVSLRLRDDQVERLERAARQMGKSPSSAALALLEEALREQEFPWIEFRDTAVGRQAFLKGTRLKVWMVKWLADGYEGDMGKLVEHLGLPAFELEAALAYAARYREEMDEAIADNDRGPEELKKLLPNLEVITVSLGEDEDAAAS